MSEEFIRTGEVARLLGTTQEAVRWLADSGQLPYQRTGRNGNHRFRHADVVAHRDRPACPQVVVREGLTQDEVRDIARQVVDERLLSFRLLLREALLEDE